MYNQPPQQLTKKFHQMGVLLLLDTPNALQFGIDNMTWQIGNKFKGIKLIPLGTHIITYALKNQNYLFPIKKFLWFGHDNKNQIQSQRILVFRWSSKSERFIALKGQQAQGYRQGVKKYHFDCYLGPYPPQNIQFWKTNTQHITKQVLDKLDPIQYYQSSQQQYTSLPNHNKPPQPAIDIDQQSQQSQKQQQFCQQQKQPFQQQQQQNKNNTKQSQSITNIKKNIDFGGNIYYSQIPRRLTQQSTHTSLINIDRTQILQTVIKCQWVNYQFGILGQLQYSFVAFLIGQCLDSYQQWKKLTILLSSSEKAFDTHQKLMLQFISILYTHLTQFPSDFFTTQLTQNNFINFCINNFKHYQKQQTINKKALTRINKFLNLIENKFIFHQKVLQEDQPVIVQENQSYF